MIQQRSSLTGSYCYFYCHHHYCWARTWLTWIEWGTDTEWQLSNWHPIWPPTNTSAINIKQFSNLPPPSSPQSAKMTPGLWIPWWNPMLWVWSRAWNRTENGLGMGEQGNNWMRHFDSSMLTWRTLQRHRNLRTELPQNHWTVVEWSDKKKKAVATQYKELDPAVVPASFWVIS